MKCLLRLSIGRDESRWSWDEFYAEEANFYQTVVNCFATHKGKVEDWYVEFREGTPELAATLKQLCESKGYNYDIGVAPKYTSTDIKKASFVPLFTECAWLDSDRDDVPLNKYEAVICEVCGRCDESQVPNPYRINKKVLKKPPDIFRASNGIVVLSERAFELLWDDVKQWVQSGEVVIWDKGQVVPCTVKYKWFRPTSKVGMFTDARVLQRCDKCGLPTEIREVRSEDDIFEVNKEIVESFQNVSAPIALAGNWFGEIEPGKACNNHWEVFISGALHEKIRKLKLKGFVKADCIIHSAEEEKSASCAG